MHTCNATDLELKTSQLQQQANNQDGSWSLIMFSVRHQDVVRARHPVSKMWCKQDMENMLRANHAVVKTWCGEDVAYARQGVNRTCLVKTCCCQHVVWSRHCCCSVHTRRGSSCQESAMYALLLSFSAHTLRGNSCHEYATVWIGSSASQHCSTPTNRSDQDQDHAGQLLVIRGHLGLAAASGGVTCFDVGGYQGVGDMNHGGNHHGCGNVLGTLLPPRHLHQGGGEFCISEHVEAMLSFNRQCTWRTPSTTSSAPGGGEVCISEHAEAMLSFNRQCTWHTPSTASSAPGGLVCP
eukprot:1150441-Pelagomonas_calceolata.AAC.4